MIDLEASTICWTLGAVQALGLTSAWLARLSLGSRCQSACQLLFVACLALVGAATLISFGLGPGQWLPAGFTLAAMVVAVTCDFSPSRHATVLGQ